MAIHLGPRLPAASCSLPGQRTGGGSWRSPCRPYLTLLPVGLAVPLPSPGTRWALTPPFHPCRRTRWRGPRRSVLCGAFPGVAGCPSPAGRYPAPCLCGARTFLTPRPKATARGHPAIRSA